MTARFDPQGLLALRDWIVSVLGKDDASSDERWHRVADLPVETWRTFLSMERCALEARSILDRVHGQVPSDLVRLIDKAASTELQRFLSAVGQIRRIAAITDAAGMRVVVLKGGVAALTGDPVALDDLDLLVPHGDVEVLSAALDRAGYASWGPDRPSTPPERYAPHLVPVDLHRAIHLLGDPEAVLARARQVPSLRGVLRLAPADHLWHLLVHVSYHHPDRRGRIRDLPLLARAVADCGSADLDEVAARIAAHPDSVPMDAHLDMACRITHSENVEDRFRKLAWRKYDAAARLGWLQRGEKARLLRMHVIRSICAQRRWLDEVRDLGERRPGVVPFLRRSGAYAVAGLLARWIVWRQRRAY